MKRFTWKLQRVLDITARREDVLRGELVALTQALVRVREELAARHAVVRTILAELGRRDLAARLAEQRILMDAAAVEERHLARLRGRIDALEAERDEKQAAFLRTRSTRRTLERLREEARQAHAREAARREQTRFDETAHLAFARGAAPANGLEETRRRS